MRDSQSALSYRSSCWQLPCVDLGLGYVYPRLRIAYTVEAICAARRAAIYVVERARPSVSAWARNTRDAENTTSIPSVELKKPPLRF